jgi:hypothetical protein
VVIATCSSPSCMATARRRRCFNSENLEYPATASTNMPAQCSLCRQGGHDAARDDWCRMADCVGATIASCCLAQATRTCWRRKGTIARAG